MFKLIFFQNVKLLLFQKQFCTRADAIIYPRVSHTKSELYESLIMLQPNSPENSKTLKISVLGCPNSGKSTLVNMLTRWKVCAVSGKINTTRSKQTVVLTQDNVQLCFIDMPGVIGRKKGFNFKLERSLIRDPHVGIFESDLIVCVIDVTHKGSYDELNVELLKALHFFRDKPSILVLNKIDRVDKKMRLFDITKKLSGGVVGGKVSHIDRYANRFRHSAPSFPELIADDRMNHLYEKHRSVSIPKSLNSNEDERTVTNHEAGNIEDDASQDITSKDIGMSLVANENKESETYGDYAVISDSSRELVVESELMEIMKTLNPSGKDASLFQQDFEMDDQILDVLKTQLMMKTATKEQVKGRLEKWREISKYLNRTNETNWLHFDDVFAVSSATGHGIDRLRDYLINRAKPGPWFFHSSLITDQEPETLVRMSIWASCLNKLEKEIPYNLKIKVTNYEKSADGSLHILVTISCNRSRQLMALIGSKGSNISAIADQSREILQNCFRTDVYLKVVARRVGVATEHLQRMRSAKDFRDLYPTGNSG